MPDKLIDEITKQFMAKEKFLAFYIWKTGKRYGYDFDKAEIEDLISDSYLTAVSKLKNRPDLTLRYPFAWFLKIVFLTSMNSIRKRLKNHHILTRELLEDLENTSFVYETIDGDIDDSIIKDVIEKKLAPDEREVLKMNLEGYSYDEIADSLSKSKEAIRQIRSRSIKKIKKLLN